MTKHLSLYHCVLWSLRKCIYEVKICSGMRVNGNRKLTSVSHPPNELVLAPLNHILQNVLLARL